MPDVLGDGNEVATGEGDGGELGFGSLLGKEEELGGGDGVGGEIDDEGPEEALGDELGETDALLVNDGVGNVGCTLVLAVVETEAPGNGTGDIDGGCVLGQRARYLLDKVRTVSKRTDCALLGCILGIGGGNRRFLRVVHELNFEHLV